MRQSLFVCLCCLWSCLSHAQKTDFPFQWVEMPLDVKEILKEKYEDKNCGAESNVYNIGVRDDVEPQNGVYWYHGMGPHFPHKVFVYYNNDVYVLKGDVEYSPHLIIQDFAKSVEFLRISETDSLAYLNAIMNTIGGKETKTTSKKKLLKKEVSQYVLEGQWFLHISKKKTRRKVEWDRNEGLSYVALLNANGLYSMSFFSNTVDVSSTIIDGLSLKKAFYYNNKLFLYLTKKYKRNKVTFIVSKNGEDIRKNHYGTTYETVSPISTRGK